MRDSAGAEYRCEYHPDHYAVGLTLTASWIPQTFLKKVKAPPAVSEHPEVLWNGFWGEQKGTWEAALALGDVDSAWKCWNTSAVQSLGLQEGDRGTLKVQWANSPELKRDATITQDLQARHDLEQAWYRVQEETIPLTHWPSVAGQYLPSQESQRHRLEEVRLQASRERSRKSKEGWEKFVKESAETSPSKLFKWVRGTTKVWDLAVQTPEGWASSPGEVADSELRAWSKLWKPGHTSRQTGGHRFLEPPSSSLGGLWEVLARIKKGKALGADHWTISELKSLGPEAVGRLEVLLCLFEQQGRWPEQLREMLYLQLPKEGAKEAGQRRPIALLPMIYRVWAAWQKHR
eukprot:3139194-Amphidinium_carterae.1